MKILVLGSGGRAPAGQAACRQCDAARAMPAASARLPAAVAITAQGGRWLLLSASHELARHPQIEAAADAGMIGGVVLLDAQPAHVAGLRALSGHGPLNLYATPGVFEELTGRLSLAELTDGSCAVRWHLLPVAGDTRDAPFHVEGLPTLRLHAIDAGGCAAPYSPHRREAVVGDRIALRVEDLQYGQRLYYSPDTPGDDARPWMDGADCLLVNGSSCPFDDAAGPAWAPAAALQLQATGARRTVLIHLNDCDPLLDAASTQRRAVEAAGIELAYDGMEIQL